MSPEKCGLGGQTLVQATEQLILVSRTRGGCSTHSHHKCPIPLPDTDANGPACCNQDHGIFSPEQIVDMVARCDYVVVATPHTPGTHKLVSAAAIQAMQPHCVLINVGRGKCVDEAALTAGEVQPADAVLCCAWSITQNLLHCVSQ